jgi:hypothetical protein
MTDADAVEVPGDAPAVLRVTLEELQGPVLAGLAFVGAAAILVEVVGAALRRRR